MPSNSSNTTTQTVTDTTKPKKFVDLENARYSDQRQVMETIIKEGHCPFCPGNWQKYNPDPPLRVGKHWFLTKNKWPYENTKNHFLLVTHQHVESFKELSSEAAAELFELTTWAIEKFELAGGALALRFGDTDYSAGTVQHLHAQLIQPDIHLPNYSDNPVKLKIGKTKK